VKRFDYLAPSSLDEALEMLAQRPVATPLAGGTNILVQIKEGHRSETLLLSLQRLTELKYIDPDYGGAHALAIGAGVTMKRIAADPHIQERYPALATAAGLIGSVQTRNMATLGGNLCNASPSADTAAPLLALDAQAVLVSSRDVRTIPLLDFFTGPGTTVLQPDELLKDIVIPASVGVTGSAYVRHIPRAAMDISVVGVAAAVKLNPDKTIGEARIALGAVAPTPIRAAKAEQLLIDRLPDEAILAEAGSAAAGEARPVDDVRASVAYRRHLVAILTQDALRQAIDYAELRR